MTFVFTSRRLESTYSQMAAEVESVVAAMFVAAPFEVQLYHLGTKNLSCYKRNSLMKEMNLAKTLYDIIN